MEYGLGLHKIGTIEVKSLNPCFNGIWSRTAKTINNCYSVDRLSFRDRSGQF